MTSSLFTGSQLLNGFSIFHFDISVTRNHGRGGRTKTRNILVTQDPKTPVANLRLDLNDVDRWEFVFLDSAKVTPPLAYTTQDPLS